MNDILNKYVLLVRKEMRLLSSISLGIFIFILFFQPFPLDDFDFNNKLLVVAALAAITFVLMVVVRTILSKLFNAKNHEIQEKPFANYMNGFILLALSSVAFAFFLRYVGHVQISFYVMSKVLLICVVPPVVLAIYDEVLGLKKQNKALLQLKDQVLEQVAKYKDDYLNQSIEFLSDNKSENLSLLVADVAIIKSADNYVEIIYREGDVFRKKLMRSTLKNMEHLLKPYSVFKRCHRTCLVNTHYIQDIHKDESKLWLSIAGFEEKVPVSRQYLLALNQAI